MANFPSFSAVSQLLKYGLQSIRTLHAHAHTGTKHRQKDRQNVKFYIPLTIVKTLFDISVSQPESNVYTRVMLTQPNTPEETEIKT